MCYNYNIEVLAARGVEAGDSCATVLTPGGMCVYYGFGCMQSSVVTHNFDVSAVVHHHFLLSCNNLRIKAISVIL